MSGLSQFSFLIVVFSCFVTSWTKAGVRMVRPYCEVSDALTSILFNFTALSESPNDTLIEDKKSGDHIRLRLCQPLNEKCDDSQDYRICLTKKGKEYGIGTQWPEPMDPSSGKLEYLFTGGACDTNRTFQFRINMICKNIADVDSKPQLLDDDGCNYNIIWKTKAACGPAKTTNCTAVDKTTGEHYDLSDLILPSENYIVPTHETTRIILNVCRNVVYNHDVRCPYLSGACERTVKEDQSIVYRNLGDLGEGLNFNEKTKELILEYAPGEICMQHTDGDPTVKTVITFTCDHHATSSQPKYIGGAEDCVHRITWRTRAACSIESLTNDSIVPVKCQVLNPVTKLDYDLSELMGKNFESSAPDGMQYRFQVCGPVTDGSCNSTSGACIAKNGTSTGAPNSNLLWSHGGPYLNYTNGDLCGNNRHRYTIIAFFCGAEKSMSKPTVMENEDCGVIIHWNTPLACNNQIKCQTKDGKFALTSLIRSSDNYVVKENGTEFHINVCRSLVPKSYLTCLHGSAACKVIPTENGRFVNETSLGYSDENPYFDDDKNLILRYTGGSACPEDSRVQESTNLIFVCNETAGKGAPRYKSYNNCTHSFEWNTSFVCNAAEGRLEQAECAIVHPHLSRKIDFTPLRRKSAYEVASQSGNSYHISICDGGEKCGSSAGVCKGDLSYGNEKKVIFDYNRNTIKVLYSKGSECKTGPSSSKVDFICDESVGIGEPKLILEPTCNAVFEWRTKVICNYTKYEDKPIAQTPKVEESAEAPANRAGTSIALGITFSIIVIAVVFAAVYYLHRRPQWGYLDSLVGRCRRREPCRAQYTKVDSAEEAQLLLHNEHATDCLTGSESEDDERLDA